MDKFRTDRTITNKQVEHVAFEIADKRGRQIGARIETFEATFTEITDEGFSYYTQAPGHYFGFRPRATRNGEWFGASQRQRYFKTQQERAEAIAKYLADAKKRAAKAA